jgi:flagellar protein FlgJ
MSDLALNDIAPLPTTDLSGHGAEAVKPADPHYQKQVKDAAVKFEGMFIGQLLHEMRSSTRALAADDSIFKDHVDRDMQDFADTQLADALAGQHAFGIADMIVKQLLPADSNKKT